MAVIVVQGTGDVGSAVAYMLHKAGHRVVMHDSAAPSHSRRRMAFVDALYEGTAELQGVLAKRARTLRDLWYMVRCPRAVPVVDEPLERVIATVRPEILVDARMRKRERPETQRGLAPLTVGLGPNFEPGVNVDVAIETAWGDELGAVLWCGRTRDLAGEPQTIAGHARDRYVYAPVAGIFTTPFNVGDAVVQGQQVARIGDTALAAPLSGYLRGLTHDGAPVQQGAKIIEVDPSGSKHAVAGLGERPRRIAEGVLKAIEASKTRPIAGPAKPFMVGALIATLGGLIGLGGAEFRLPALVGLFRFELRQAIAVNVIVSLVTVAASLVFRVGMQGSAELWAHVDAVVALLSGALVGAFIGSGLVSRLNAQRLHRAVGALLIALAVVMAGHALVPTATTPLIEPSMVLFALAVACGVGIGVVGSMLGVAGGELLIPTLVLLFGIDVKTAGTLSLAISLPMLLVTVSRLGRGPATRAAFRCREFIAMMALGSLLGAFIGSRLAGVAPEHALSLILAAILFISAWKTFAPRSGIRSH